MIDDLRGILGKVSAPGDLATVLIAGTAGFLIDAGLNAVGFLEPGYVGITAASSALGIKKSVEAGLTKRRERKAKAAKLREELERAKSLKRLLEEKKQNDLIRRLDREIELFESGVADADSLRLNVNRVADEYRARSEKQEMGA